MAQALLRRGGRALLGSTSLSRGFAEAAAAAVEEAPVSVSSATSSNNRVLRAIARKAKAEIFSKDLGKRVKIHLKPSLLSSKLPLVSSKEQAQEAEVESEAAAVDVEERRRRFIEEELCAEPEEDSLVGQGEVGVTVEALFLARSVDLKSLAQDSRLKTVPGRNHVVIKLDDVITRDGSYVPTPECLSNNKLIVVFQYGAVVLFNFEGYDEDLKLVLKHCREVLPEPKKDNYRIVMKPGLQRWSQAGADSILVRKLDIDAVRIISMVLSQSTALDHYTRGIDGMLNTFGELNRKMELTGTFSLKRKELFKLVAAANTSLADAILRLGLLDRSDVAWQNVRYDRIWEHMREEFELDDRFESLEFKIDIIQHNVKFFLDILQNRKSDTLEWIIIVLIAAEICVGIYEISSHL